MLIVRSGMLRRNPRQTCYCLFVLLVMSPPFMKYHHHHHHLLFAQSYLLRVGRTFGVDNSNNSIRLYSSSVISTSHQLQHHVYNTRLFATTSVTGPVYVSEDAAAPTVRLFTKDGCTLCDKVKDVLQSVRTSHPHSLEQIDITDAKHQDWFDRYKYDIPVLHVNGQYWIKHRMTQQEAGEGLNAARQGTFTSPPGEPNASAMERK